MRRISLRVLQEISLFDIIRLSRETGIPYGLYRLRQKLLLVEDDDNLKKNGCVFFSRKYRLYGVRCGRSGPPFDGNGKFRRRCSGPDPQKQRGHRSVPGISRIAARGHFAFPGRRRQPYDRSDLRRSGLCHKALLHAPLGNTHCTAAASENRRSGNFRKFFRERQYAYRERYDHTRFAYAVGVQYFVLLIKNPGKYFTADEIHENIWCAPSLHTTTIRTHLSSLRRKQKAVMPAGELISTEFNKGSCFTGEPS